MIRFVVLTAAAVALAASAAPATTCTTPAAPDGHEPPCNPALASAEWSGAHRSSYAQASSPFPGPAPGQSVRVEHTPGVEGIPIVVTFTRPYGDGGRAAWFSTVGTPDSESVYKVDFATGRVIDQYSVSDEQRPPATTGDVSGAYNVLDADNRLIVGRAGRLEVYEDAVPGARMSGIRLRKRLTIPASALCRPSDRLVGITMLFDGHVAFATAQGVVGVIPRDPAAMSAQSLRTHSLNGARCADAAVADADLEQVSNSIAADEDGGIYVVTSGAQYRLDWNGAALTPTWRAAYQTGGASGVRLGAGSGSTPTVMGTGQQDDRFVVITDGQRLMHLVLMWRDAIPADWQPIAPGRDRRIACEIPVRFGDAAATASLSEQSVLVRGYASVVVNNQLRGTDSLDSFPPTMRTAAAALAGQSPAHAPYGLERIDWNPLTRTCSTRWANREVSIPNGIPSMSTATGLVYGIGQRNGIWGLEGIDFASGASRLWLASTPSPDQNSFYAATTIGPAGTVWTGTLLGYTIFRPAPALLPAPLRARAGCSPQARAGCTTG